jgi:hypothetical protein
MSLYLVSRLLGDELAERTARQIDYSWNEINFNRINDAGKKIQTQDQ